MKSLLPCSAEMEKDVNGIDERKNAGYSEMLKCNTSTGCPDIVYVVI